MANKTIEKVLELLDQKYDKLTWVRDNFDLKTKIGSASLTFIPSERKGEVVYSIVYYTGCNGCGSLINESDYPKVRDLYDKIFNHINELVESKEWEQVISFLNKV